MECIGNLDWVQALRVPVKVKILYISDIKTVLDNDFSQLPKAKQKKPNC